MATQSRPLSPHLQIYKPQITSVMSILHRATGMVLALGAVFLVWWLAAAAAGPQSYAGAQAFFGSWFGQLGLLAWSFAFYYHLCNGLRHLYWDTGRGMSIEAVNRSGMVALVAALVLVGITWAVAL